MEVFNNIKEIDHCLEAYRAQGLSIGFVPTMGALHDGHLALIRQCKSECDISVCSIFVNPLQFNRRDDYDHYPVTSELDLSLLHETHCNLLFAPEAKEMYPQEILTKYDFGLFEQVMEGKFRPGHFNGVAIAVKRLFDIIQPHRAYFGEKDYQQLLVIRRLVEFHRLKIEIIPCPIVREADGLAMSSRNRRLNMEERRIAPHIYQILRDAVVKAKEMRPESLKNYVAARFLEHKPLVLEYFDLSDAATLDPVVDWEHGQEVIACVAVFLGSVRLIDNIRFFT